MDNKELETREHIERVRMVSLACPDIKMTACEKIVNAFELAGYIKPVVSEDEVKALAEDIAKFIYHGGDEEWRGESWEQLHDGVRNFYIYQQEPQSKALLSSGYHKGLKLPEMTNQSLADTPDEGMLQGITKLVALSCYPEWDDNGKLIPYESLSDYSLSPAKDVANEILSKVQSIYRAKVEKQMKENKYSKESGYSGFSPYDYYIQACQDTLKILGGK